MNENYTFTYEEMIAFMKSAPANIFFKDTECKYRFTTEVCDLVYGGPDHSILGKTDREIQVNKEYGEFYYQDDLNILATGKPNQYINEFPSPEGPMYYEIRKRPVWKDGKIIGIIGIVDDITERIRLEKELEELSYRDALTGLYNRNYAERKGKELEKEFHFPITLIMADCNYLKKVNDRYGHEYGDMYIKRVARILRENLSPENFVIRMGGDEFLLVCQNCSAEMTRMFLPRLKAALNAAKDDRLPMDVAFGSYTTEAAPFDFHTAYHLADREMYQNKQLDHIRIDQAAAQN